MAKNLSPKPRSPFVPIVSLCSCCFKNSVHSPQSSALPYEYPLCFTPDDWIQIAPLGDHPHQLGIQRITPDSAAAMANRFNSFRARLGRLFSGVPMFEGHHDTDPDKYPNGRSFAWVMELQNRAGDGLWAKMKWTDEGRDLVATGKYKFISPVWNAREVTRENGRPIFIPETQLPPL